MKETSKLGKAMSRVFRVKILADHFKQAYTEARAAAIDELREAGISLKVGDKKYPFDEGEIAGMDTIVHRVRIRVLKAKLEAGEVTFEKIMSCVSEFSTTKLNELFGKDVAVETTRTPGTGFKFFDNQRAKDAVNPAVAMLEAALAIAPEKQSEEVSETKAA